MISRIAQDLLSHIINGFEKILIKRTTPFYIVHMSDNGNSSTMGIMLVVLLYIAMIFVMGLAAGYINLR